MDVSYNFQRFLLLFIFGCLFYLLNIFSPYISDDFFYSFIMEDGFGSDIEYRPILSFSDIVESQIWAWNHHNGRFLVHSLVQFFCALNNIWYFSFFNTIFYILLIYGISKYVFREDRIKNIDCFIIFLLLFLFIPLMGITYLGNISFSINYLWSSSFNVWFILLLGYVRNSKKMTPIKFVGCCIYSLICGSLQESFSFGISIALLLYLLKNYDNKYVLFIVVSYWVGSAITIMAPSNFLRLNAEGTGFGIMSIIMRLIRVSLSLRAFWILCVLLVIGLFKQRNIIIKYIKKNSLIITAVIFNILFAIVVVVTGKHQLVAIELFSLILIVRLIYAIWGDGIIKYEKIVYVSFFLFFVFLYIPIFYYRNLIYNSYVKVLNCAKTTSCNEIVAEDYEELCLKDNYFLNNFTRKDNFYKYNRMGLSLYVTKGKDINYIKTVLPSSKENLVNMCVESNKYSDCIYKVNNKNYYIIRLSRTIKLEDVVIKSYIEPGFIGKYIYNILEVRKKTEQKTYNIAHITDLNQFSDDEYIYVIYNPTQRISDLKIEF